MRGSKAEGESDSPLGWQFTKVSAHSITEGSARVSLCDRNQTREGLEDVMDGWIIVADPFDDY